MDRVDLFFWAQRHLHDAELSEVARAVRDLIDETDRDVELVRLARVLVATHPATIAWWDAYRTFVLWNESHPRP